MMNPKENKSVIVSDSSRTIRTIRFLVNNNQGQKQSRLSRWLPDSVIFIIGVLLIHSLAFIFTIKTRENVEKEDKVSVFLAPKSSFYKQQLDVVGPSYLAQNEKWSRQVFNQVSKNNFLENLGGIPEAISLHENFVLFQKGNYNIPKQEMIQTWLFFRNLEKLPQTHNTIQYPLCLSPLGKKMNFLKIDSKLMINKPLKETIIQIDSLIKTSNFPRIRIVQSCGHLQLDYEVRRQMFTHVDSLMDGQYKVIWHSPTHFSSKEIQQDVELKEIEGK